MKLQHRDGTVTEQEDSLAKPLGFLYGNVFGRLLLKPLTARWVSRLTGAFLSTPLSKGFIKPFIRKNGIDMSQFEEVPYRSYNEFFSRKIKPEARPVDMEKYEEAKAREHDTMIRSRQIAKELELDMKIGDVEYQGDGLKAIFYYIADNRVDFRQLIKVLADAFKIKIEMKQIGARQEAGRIGGIGPCGRELCCATFTTNFVSVSTSAARFQDISLNPQKLAGQCAKLKCCMNYEVDAYVEASRHLPQRDIELETKDGTYYFFKCDILRGEITYSTDKHIPANLVTISSRRAHAVIEMNKRGEKPDNLQTGNVSEQKRSVDLLEQENINRFDGEPRNGKKRRKGNGGNRPESKKNNVRKEKWQNRAPKGE